MSGPASFDSSLAGVRAAASPNPFAAVGGQDASVRLEMGTSYEGVVVAADQANLAYSVRLDSPQIVVPDCLYTGETLGALLSLSGKYRVPLGTRVLMTWTGRGIIVKLLPSEMPDFAGAEARVMTTTDLKAKEVYGANVGETKRGSNRGPTPEADAYEGEMDLTNPFKVGVALMTHFAQLKAGDRAKVETHILNDMVRIVSERFEHLSCLGDLQIINDGRLNCIFNGTSYPFEAQGVRDGEAWAKTDDNGMVDFASAQETGRWRFSAYLGHLGNFISAFVTDPVAGLGELAQERAGKFHAHVNNDGSFVLRSVADIVLERVTRIQVPIQRHRLDSPEGKTKAAYGSVDTSYLRQWKYSSTSSPWQAAYQLRDYARWLSTYHSYARFLQSQDFELQTEAESPKPSMTNDEKDVKSAGTQTYIDTYACYRIMRDGSTVQLDGYGNCTTTTAFGIHHASPHSITLEAADNIHLLAGNNIYCRARRSIEVVAAMGGVLVAAKTYLKNLCELGPSG